MHNIKLQLDYVWIGTYPKSGTAWIRQIEWLIISRGKEDGLTLEDAVPWVEGFVKS